MGRKKKIELDPIIQEIQKFREIIKDGAKPTFNFEEYQIAVIPKNDLPAPNEIFIRTKYVPGSFLFLAEALQGNRSFLKPDQDYATMCVDIIRELDKGNNGLYDDAYYMNADLQTPGLYQFVGFQSNFLKFWKDKVPPSDGVYQTQYGLHMRVYHRQPVFRFMCYFKLGYDVKFTVIPPQPLISSPT